MNTTPEKPPEKILLPTRRLDPALVEFPALREALVELIAEDQAEFLDKS